MATTYKQIQVIEGPSASRPSARAGAHMLHIGTDTYELTFSDGTNWVVTQDHKTVQTEATMAALTSTENTRIVVIDNETMYKLKPNGKSAHPLQAHTSVQSATGADDIWWAINGKYAVLRWIDEDVNSSSSTSSESVASVSSISESLSSASSGSASLSTATTSSTSESSGAISGSSIPVSQSTPSSLSSSKSTASASTPTSESVSTASSVSSVGTSGSTGSSATSLSLSSGSLSSPSTITESVSSASSV